MFPRISLASLVILLLVRPMLTQSNATQMWSPARLCNGPGENRLKARFGIEYHWLCLRRLGLEWSPLLAKNSFLYVDKVKQDLDSCNVSIWHGYTIGLGSGGNADGYLSKDGQFVGTLVFDNRIIYTDSYDDEKLLKIFVKFDHDHSRIFPYKVHGKKMYKREAPSHRRHHRPKAETKFDNTSLSTTPAWSEQPTSSITASAKSSPSYKRTSIRRSQESSSSLPIYEYRFKPKTKKKKPPIPSYIVAPTPPVQESAKARLCELLVLADHPYYLKDVNSSLDMALKRILHAVSVADMVFRNTDFDEDGMPDNVGFALKYVMVLTTAERDRTVFGDLPPNRPLDGREYLMRFAALSKLRDVCLGVAFTGRTFKNNTIGFSFSSTAGGAPGGFAGGMCQHDDVGLSFNTLAVSHGGAHVDGKSMRISVRLAEIAMLHEMGHSFGANHDELFNRPECERHIMSRGTDFASASGFGKFEFSECSRDAMRQTIDKGRCLVYDDRSYCGNGIVEGGEACDCGLASRCASMDRCCTPRAGTFGLMGEKSIHVAGCSVAPNALCHPSQGGCCDRNCHFVDLSADGIDCSRMQEKCPCDDETERCPCGLGGECLPNGSCVAAECARLGLEECTCPHHGPGGAVGAAHRCGVCCILPAPTELGEALGETQCAGAETAATRFVSAGLVMLEDLRDDDFSGPSVFYRLCTPSSMEECDYVSLRAWYKRGACAALGRLGECSPDGVCVPPARPAPNLFPMPVNQRTPSRRSGQDLIAQCNGGNKFQSYAIFLVCFIILCQSIL